MATAKKTTTKKVAKKATKKSTSKPAAKKTATKKTTAKKTTTQKTSANTSSRQNSAGQTYQPSQDSLYSCLEAFDVATSSFAKGMSHGIDYLGEQWEDIKEDSKESFEDIRDIARSEFDECVKDYKKWSKENPALATTLATTAFSLASAVVLRVLTKRH